MLSLLVRASLEGALLAGGVWLLCRALPRLSPSVRALLWWCVAAKFVVALAWPAPIGVPLLPPAAADAPGAAVAVADAPPLSRPQAAGTAARPLPRPTVEPAAREVPWAAIALGAWALGLGLSLLRTLRGWHRTRAVVSRSLPGGPELHAAVRELSGRLGLGRSADVRVSAEVEAPLVVGGRRPVILVPAESFAALPPEQQRMALCHELAHLKRGDLWLGCVPAAAERFFFFHPLARLAAREYAFWREAACDEAVLHTLGASPQSYGRMLLALGVSRRTAAFSAPGAAWSFQNLKRRLTMLDRTSSPSLRGRALAAGALAAALLAIVPIRVVARSAEPSAPAASSAHSTSRVAAAVPALPPVLATRAEPPAERAGSPLAAAVTARAAETAETAEQRSDELPFVLFRGEGNTMMSGSTGDVERARRHRRPGESLLWFRYDGREYVVRDPGVLREVQELWAPVDRIGEEQGRIGAQQGTIGEEQGRTAVQQAEIGARQAEAGARQAVAGSRLALLATREAAGVMESERRDIERQREDLQEESRWLQREMEVLGRRMREASAPMLDRSGEMTQLGREMAALGDRMRTAVERANAGMLALARRAVESGTAVTVR